jgi:hypothetical protein
MPVDFHQPPPSDARLIRLQRARNYIPWHASHEACKAPYRREAPILARRAPPPARQALGRGRGAERAAEAAAILQFNLSQDQLHRLVVREEE